MMALAKHQPDVERITALLQRWLARCVSKDGLAWLEGRRRQIGQAAPDRILFTAFSAAPRRLGKANLDLVDTEKGEAEAVRPGWRPDRWSSDQAGRTLLLLSLDRSEAEAFGQRLEKLFGAGDVGELVALYQALPLLPFPEQHRARAAEGVRTNMASVFEAVALYDPYPAEQLADDAWNQMVLKAVFLGSPLHAIHGLDQRANPKLARMLVDYAHERWAAKRPVTPELWRPVGPFAEQIGLDDLARVFDDPDPMQHEAAALALAQSPAVPAKALLAHRPDLEAAIVDGTLTWSSFSRDRLNARS